MLFVSFARRNSVSVLWKKVPLNHTPKESCSFQEYQKQTIMSFFPRNREGDSVEKSSCSSYVTEDKPSSSSCSKGKRIDNVISKDSDFPFFHEFLSGYFKSFYRNVKLSHC